MPFPPYPPWVDRREGETAWHLHDDRHDRDLALAAERRHEHDALHTGDRATDDRARAEHATLHEHERLVLGERLHEHALAHAREHEMSQRALDKAEAADNLRFDSVNEFRKTLTDQAATFARTETLEARLQAITARQDASEKNLNERRDALADQLGNRLTPLEAFKNSTQGQTLGQTDTRAMAIATIGIVIAVTGTVSGILLHFIH